MQQENINKIEENNAPDEKKSPAFPAGFLWGAAISSYQTEDNNSNSDWYALEMKIKQAGESEINCDYWNQWREYHNLLSELGAKAFRLSLEWPRLEPEEGRFSNKNFQHYREILHDLKDRNIKTVVTFWHWTSPVWFQEKYGFHKKESVEIFSRYGKKIIDELGDLIDIAVILNEPMMPLTFGFLLGKFPPYRRCFFKYKKAFRHLSEAYKIIYDYSKKKFPAVPVGVTILYNYFEPANKNNPLHRLIVGVYKKFWNESFFNSIKDKADYFGLDYYFHYRLALTGRKNENKKISDMGWEIYPEGIYEVLKEIKAKYNLPIYILENGLADKDDKYRAEFIRDHLKYVRQAIEGGIDVRGYFYWSLMDNFEWLHGYAPKFGLVAVDSKTLERKPRKSFYFYKSIIEKNGLE
ncbi:MAG: glycoside hydrolase family 1 protein [Candidatus Moranbacteria bacterium]|nr:glycoside hydrolase family 1 protein [Candidatus Moranbacteria bacterium]